MIKAGIIAVMGITSLLLASTPTHAQETSMLSLLSSPEQHDPCDSALSLYFISCTPQHERPTRTDAIMASDTPEEFSVSHSYETATYTPTPTPTVIVSEIQLATPSPTVIVSEATVAPHHNDATAVLELVNAHRASIGKPAFVTDGALCTLAQTRSGELAGEIANGSLHSGLYNRNLPHWTTENAKVGGDEAETVRWWLNSSIHRSQIQSDYTHACVGCTGRNCALVFTSYNPKNYQVATSTQSSEVK